MKKIILYIAFLFLLQVVRAQKINRTFFSEDSVLKSSFLNAIAEKKKDVFNNIPKINDKDYKKIYTTSFENIETFIKSKAPITDKEVQAYLQQLVNQIVENNNELKNLSLRVVFSRDYIPNAYSMGDGTIVFNAGLLIYLQNEAEIIFVLCHEIAHFYLQHQQKSINKYVEVINDSEYQKQLKNLSKKEFGVNTELEQLAKKLVFDNSRHSREHEAEADYYGFKLMKQTKFNTNGIISCLQILDKVDDSLLTKPLNVKMLLNSHNFPFKNTWVEEESSIFGEIKTTKDEVENKDSLKTHPDCIKRIDLLKDSISKIDSRNKVYFSNSSSQFEVWKEKFYYEIIEYCYQNNDLSKNLYYSLLLVQNKRDLPYAIFSIGRCFNSIYEKQKNHSLGLAIELENKKFNSDYNDLLKLLSRVSLYEIAAINYNFCKENATIGIQYNGFEEIGKQATKNFTNK